MVATACASWQLAREEVASPKPAAQHHSQALVDMIGVHQPAWRDGQLCSPTTAGCLDLESHFCNVSLKSSDVLLKAEL